MKKQLFYLLASVAIVAAGCSEKDAEGGTGYGRVAIDCGTDIELDTRAVPSGSRFSLVITGDNYRGEWTTVLNFKAQDTIFLEGPYKAIIAYGDPLAEGPDKAYYYGEQDFSVIRRQTANVLVEAKVANSQTVVRATKAFLEYFNNAKFTVTTGSGNKFDFAPAFDDKGIPTSGTPVYVKAATTLSVTGTARRQSWDGTTEGMEVKFGEQRLAATTPRTCHIFLFDANDKGQATLEIYLGDDFTETRPIDVELNEGAIPDNE